MKKIFFPLLGVTLIMLLLTIFRAYTYVSPISDEPSKYVAEAVSVESAAQRLSSAITYKTMSSLDNNAANAQDFIGLQDFLRKEYPLIFQKLEAVAIEPFGLVLKWQGLNDNLKPILLMAHQDVVPIAPGSESQWEHDPFAGVISDSYIFGRGALDDKASLISIMEALTLLLSQNFSLQRSVYVFLGDSEEISGPNAQKAAQYFKDKQITFEAVFDEGSFILQDGILDLKEPIAAIGVAEKGYLDVEISFQGKPGHSSVPPKETAIGIISEAIFKLQNHRWYSQLGDLQTVSLEILGSNMSLLNRVIMTNSWLFEPLILQHMRSTPRTNAMISTTMAPTIFQAGVKSNVLPSEARATINFRIIPGETVDYVMDEIQKVISDDRINVRILVGRNPSSISDFKNNTFQSLVRITKSLYPQSKTIITPIVMVAGTDSSYFEQVSQNTYRYQPILLSNAETQSYHGTNERISFSNLEKLIQFYILLIKELNDSN